MYVRMTIVVSGWTIMHPTPKRTYVKTLYLDGLDLLQAGLHGRRVLPLPLARRVLVSLVAM